MTTKTAVLAEGTGNERNVGRLVALMTATAWVLLGIGLLFSLFNLHDFSDRNTSLMVGVGFMVGSVHIYVIRTAIHLVDSRAKAEDDSK
ncbi:hypothetical protein [Paenibacillus elgii]|uniref:Uncharacterized protein n=1 Tax=Paenibacillus elgii TaxID=189691 RepID=A0A165R656_9BACL|nr:hypothetical protein [Paenibacillus elgii]KZE79142.1 hypothetical protein AV654_16820 [Paenibacillus elgii]MCM3272205.1 hypothetical protein [Paenibacillus elgii]NEN83699.1 hypothetical protein [Paenibacillus elgii]